MDFPANNKEEFETYWDGRITIVLDDEGLHVYNVPKGVEIVVEDKIEDTDAVFGEGHDNILSQRV